mmetsp:Transcript_11327/g.27889  ORF Transcript_11327/g.27889 Transcript_11327/m.27889 type:complete len:104 (-) Transcript_11327:169-480(-)
MTQGTRSKYNNKHARHAQQDRVDGEGSIVVLSKGNESRTRCPSVHLAAPLGKDTSPVVGIDNTSRFAQQERISTRDRSSAPDNAYTYRVSERRNEISWPEVPV